MQKQKLSTLIEQLLKLIGYVERFSPSVIEKEEREEFIQNIKACIRKLVMANMLDQQYVIAVTGAQGAGKSSLVQSLYDLPENLLSIRSGRGERMPILIKENVDLKEKTYQCWKHTVSGNIDEKTNAQKVKIEQNEFAKLAEDSDIDVMYLELEVPTRYFEKNKAIAFLLLPGFERMSSYWQEFVHFALSCSDTCITVCKGEMLANSDSTVFANKLKEVLPKNALPIFAVSFSDNILMNPTNEEMKQREADIRIGTKETFGLQDNENDRVVFTGRCADDTINTQWKKTLIDACLKYAASTSKAFVEQSNALQNILKDDIQNICDSAISYASDAEDISMEAQSNLYTNTNSMLKAFNVEAKKGKDAFAKSLVKQLKQKENESFKELEEFYQKGPGMKLPLEVGKGVVNVVFGESAKTQLKNEHRFEQFVMQDVAREESGYGNVACYLALQEHGKSKASNFCTALQLKETDPLAAMLESSGTSIQEQNHQVISNAVADVQSMMRIANSPTAELVELKSHRKDIVAKALYSLSSAAYTMQAMQSLGGVSYDVQEDFTPEDLIAVTEAAQAEKEKFVDDAKGVLGASAVMAAVDFAEDGVINFLPSAAKALGISTPVVAGVAFAATIAVGTVLSVRYNNAMGKNRLVYDRIAIHKYYTTVKQNALDHYDEYLDIMREKICDYNQNLDRGLSNSMDVFNLKILLSHLDDQVRMLNEGLNAEDLHRILQETI